MEEQGQTPISFKQFIQQIMSESRMAEGGIARLGYANGQLVQPGPGRPGYAGVDWDWSGLDTGSIPDDTGSEGAGTHGSGTGSNEGAGSGGGQDHPWEDDIGTVGTADYTPPPEDQREEVAKTIAKESKIYKKKKKEYNRIRNLKPKGHWFSKGVFGLTPKTPFAYQYLYSIKNDPNQKELWDSLPQELKDLVEDTGLSGISLDKWEDKPKISYDQYNMLTQVPGYGEFLEGIGKPGVKHAGNVGGLGERYVKYERYPSGSFKLDAEGKKIKKEDKYGNVLYGYHESTGGDDPEWKNQGFPSYEAWLRTPQTGIPSATAPAATTTAAATTPPAGWNPLYHIGGGATQEQIDYMENVLGMAPGQTYLAQGGRVPAAFGGIMDTATGRRRYGLGSLNPFKAIKKLFKSKAGKAGLAALAFFAPKMGLFGADLEGGSTLDWWKKALWDTEKKGLSGWGKAAIFGGLPLAGYLTAEEDKKDPYGRDAKLAKWEKQFAGLGDYATPWYSAQGGRIGLHGGGSPEENLYLNYMARQNQEGKKYNPSRGEYESYINRPIMMGQAMPEGGLDEIRRKRAEHGPSIFAVPAADGGRIGLHGGGSPEEEDDRIAAIRALSYRPKAQEGGLMDLGGMEKDYRQEGGFVPIGGEERADDVPARLSKNEFVFTADAVRAAGGGDIDAGAEIMENVMENLEEGGNISEESQGLEGARDMFATAQRLEGVL